MYCSCYNRRWQQGRVEGEMITGRPVMMRYSSDPQQFDPPLRIALRALLPLRRPRLGGSTRLLPAQAVRVAFCRVARLANTPLQAHHHHLRRRRRRDGM